MKLPFPSHHFLLLLLLLLLRCHLGTSVSDKSSLTFIDLISGIISNARFVEENLINWKPIENETWPSIDLNQSKMNLNDSNCTRELRVFAQDLATHEIWALKTLDAWGKPPSGIMRGNLFWVGSIDECQHHLRGLNNSVVEQPFLTRSCFLGDGFTSRPVYGICVPQSCSAEEIRDHINRYTIRIPKLHLGNDSVRCLDIRHYDAKAIVTIVLLSLIALVILLSTCCHFVHLDKISITATETSTTIAIPEGENPPSDETTPLVTSTQRTMPAVRTAWLKVRSKSGMMTYGSLKTNYTIVIHEQQPRNLACLNGIRVLSLCWVIVGHTWIFGAWYSDNVLMIVNWSRHLWFQFIAQAVFSVDSFFVLSGLLTTFTFLLWKAQNERFSVVKFLINHYVYRYFRYTIFYAVILLIYICLSPYLIENGPMYPFDGIASSTCRHTWWRNLLYINNFFSSRDTCMGISWFLAVNMQFHWIAPLFLLAISWKWILSVFVAFIFILIDIICTAVIVSKNNYDYGIMSDFYRNASNSTHNYMEDVYIKPWCRLAPYAVGLVLGHVLFVFYQRSTTISWEALLPDRRANQQRWWKFLLTWLVSLSILSLCVFGTFGDYSGHPLTRSGRIAFLTLSRLGWAVGLSIIIITCFRGYASIINRFLSHRFFETLAKLTYGAFLWHELVVFVNYLGRDQPLHYTLANMFVDCLIHILITYSLSFLTFLFIESPIIQLLKSIFKRSNNVH